MTEEEEAAIMAGAKYNLADRVRVTNGALGTIAVRRIVADHFHYDVLCDDGTATAYTPEEQLEKIVAEPLQVMDRVKVTADGHTGTVQSVYTGYRPFRYGVRFKDGGGGLFERSELEQLPPAEAVRAAAPAGPLFAPKFAPGDRVVDRNETVLTVETVSWRGGRDYTYSTRNAGGRRGRYGSVLRVPAVQIRSTGEEGDAGARAGGEGDRKHETRIEIQGR